MKTKIFKKPNIWFTIFMLGTPIYIVLMIMHIFSFGLINGLGLLDEWTEYLVKKEINDNSTNRQ